MPGIAKGKTIFLKLIDANGRLVVRGEVGDAGQEGAIELLSFEIDADRPDPFGRSGGRGPFGRSEPHSASGSKAADTTTQPMLLMLATGRPSPINAEVTIIRAGSILFPASTVKVTLQNVVVFSYFPGGGGIVDGVVIDNFGLSFEKAGQSVLSRGDETGTFRARINALNVLG